MGGAGVHACDAAAGGYVVTEIGTTNLWWFRLRLPPGFRSMVPTLQEVFVPACIVAIAIDVIWLGFRVYGGKSVVAGEVAWMAVLWGSLIAIAAIPVVRNPLKFMVIARERGDMRWLDVLLLVVAAIVAYKLFRSMWMPYRPPVLLILAECAVVWVALIIQDRLILTSDRKPLPIPPWLSARPEETEGIVLPDAGSTKVYPFCTAVDDHRVGVAVGSDLLTRFRALNAQSDGRLYQRNHLAVVLADRDPVNGIGREKLLRLALQSTSIARAHALTRYAFANALLAFVQRHFDYEHDNASTATFVGGPFEEYGRFALETFVDSVGDCDCTAILCASLLAFCGFDCALLFVSFEDPKTKERCNHCAVGLLPGADLFYTEDAVFGFDLLRDEKGGPSYLYGETAVDGAILTFGGKPPEWKDFKVDGILPIPALA